MARRRYGRTQRQIQEDGAHPYTGGHLDIGIPREHYVFATHLQKVHGGGFMDWVRKIGSFVKDAAGTVGKVFNGVGKVASAVGQHLPGPFGAIANTIGNVAGTVSGVANGIHNGLDSIGAGVRFEKGSPEAKAYMALVRAAKKKAKRRGAGLH